MKTHHDSTTHTQKGASLARGPAWIVGSVLAVFGLILFFKAPGTPLSTTGFPDGTATGVKFLGFEINAWTAWLTVAAGVLVLIGALQHVIAKTLSLLVGLALGAASVIALFDGDDVLGLAAANGVTALGWGIAAAILIITALLPRLGHKDTTETVATTDRTATRDRAVDHRHPDGGDEHRIGRDEADRADRADRNREADVAPAPVARDESAHTYGTGSERSREVERPDHVGNGTAGNLGLGSDGDGNGHHDGDTEPTRRFGHADQSTEETVTTADGTRTVQIPPRRDA